MPTVLMESPVDQNIATCPTCGTLIDVSTQEPFAKIHCSSCGTWMRVKQIFTNFEIIGVLGEGGQGMVYKALDKKLNRPVAIKLMKRAYSEDPIFVKRFQSEAKVTASLNHPNIVKVYSFGEDMGLLYLAMELVEHGSLDALMSQLGKLPENLVLEVGIQIAKGLQAGLEKGLIHRDIKPGNILFSDPNTAKIVDFGLAVLVEKQHEEEGEVWATPFYVAPEKLDGTPEDFRSDMYSLAATLFHALAGRPPFIAETNSMSELKKIKSRPVHLLSYAPQATSPTAYVLDKALNAKPEDRFKSYEDFIQNLEFARNELRKAPRQSAAAQRRVVVQTGSGIGSGLTIGVLGAVVGAGLMWFFSQEKNAPVPQPGSSAQANAASTEADDAEVRYEQARFKLLNGKFAAAAAGFRELYADGRLAEPKNSWAAVHLGLADLLNGRSAAARTLFKDMGNRIEPTAIGMDAGLVSFLTRLSTLGASKQTPSAEDLEKFKSTTYEALALFILGLKEWEEGQYQSAVELMKKFQSTTPEGSSAWVGEYRPLVARYLEDYGIFSDVQKALLNYESAPAPAESALKNLEETKGKIRTPSLLSKLAEIERDLAPKITQAAQMRQAVDQQKMAAAAAAEEEQLTSAKMKIQTLCESYQFKEALAIIQKINVTLEQHVADRDLLVRRIGWLVQFKDQLLKDLEGGSFTGTVQRKTGQTLTGSIAFANETQIVIRTQFGNLQLLWNELTPQSVLAIARTYLRPTLPPAQFADRKWQAGVFSIFTQMIAESQTLMGEAAMMNQEYRIHKALFFGEAEPESVAAPEPAATPLPPVPDAPPSSGTEMSTQPLNPSRPNVNENIIRGLRPNN